MEKVKRLVRAGASLAGAVRECAGLSGSALALKHRLPRTPLVDALAGRRALTDEAAAALAAEMGGTPDDWRELQRQERIRVAQAALQAAKAA